MTLAFYAGAWLGGIIAGALGFGPYWPILALAGGGACAGVMLGGRRVTGAAMALPVLVFVLGLLGYAWEQRAGEPPGVALLNDGGVVRLRGTVIEEPEQRDTSQRLHLRVEAREVEGAWLPSSGGVLVTARPFPELRYGDVLQLEGKLKTPPQFEGFDYREYLARRGIQSLAGYPAIQRIHSGGGNDFLRLLAGVRRKLGDSLERSLPEPESALARGILLGERASIPRDLTASLNDAGISHLVAISGYNVMLLAGLTLAGLSWLMGRRPATLAAMVSVALFALFVGATPSVLRAAVMAQVLLGASLAGRPNSATGAVLLAGAVLTAVDPQIIEDVSFQLSFAATLGIVLLAKPLETAIRRLPLGPFAGVAEPAAVTIAAGAAAQPIIALSFGRVSLMALPANMAALPAFPVIMLASFVTSLAGLVSQDFGRLAGEVAYLPLAYLVWVGQTAAGLQESLASFGFGTAAAVLALGAALALTFVASRALRKLEPQAPAPPRLLPALWASLIVLLLAGFVWRDTLSAGEPQLSVTVLDVGQGDAILIETPAGQRVLIDGGPSANRLQQALGRRLQASVHRIDLMILTHAQDDHITGLVSVLDRYDVGMAVTTSLQGRTAAYNAWLEALARENVPLRQTAAGEWVDLGSGIRLEVLGPPRPLLSGTDDDVNNSSVVLRLVHGNVSFLLTGDLAAEGEQALLRGGNDLYATVLKVGHHGSDGSSTAAFLAAVQPKLAVISLGADNTYGHPSPTTRLRLQDVSLLRTDAHGDVRMRTDGSRVSIDVQKGLASQPGRKPAE